MRVLDVGVVGEVVAAAEAAAVEAAGHHAAAAMEAAEAAAVDEERRRAGGAVSAPSSTTASKVRLSPSSTGAEIVTTASATVRAGEHRDGGVRRVDVGLVLALVPFLDELRRLDVAGGAHRPVGEGDRVRRHAGQRQLAVRERRAARVQDEERRHRAGLGHLADGLLQRLRRAPAQAPAARAERRGRR